jgi:hypothetical protein
MGDLALWSTHCASKELNLSDNTLDGVLDAAADDDNERLAEFRGRSDDDDEDCASLCLAVPTSDRDRLSMFAAASSFLWSKVKPFAQTSREFQLYSMQSKFASFSTPWPLSNQDSSFALSCSFGGCIVEQ